MAWRNKAMMDDGECRFDGSLICSTVGRVTNRLSACAMAELKVSVGHFGL